MNAYQRQALHVQKFFKVQEAAQFMWSLAMFMIEPGAELVRAMSNVAAATTTGWQPQCIAQLVWAFATLGIKPGPKVAEVVAKGALETADRFSSQAAADFLWAMAALDLGPEAKLAEAIAKKTRPDDKHRKPWKDKAVVAAAEAKKAPGTSACFAISARRTLTAEEFFRG